MNRDPFFRRALFGLVAAALALPIVICVLAGLSAMLGSMGDTAGGQVCGRLALAGGVLWTTGLVLLLVIQALLTLFEDRGE